MSFSPDWLALREPVDHAARDADLLAQAVAAAGSDAVVMDLGCGTGSTARAFAGHAIAGWTWRFVDEDKGLLEIVKARHPLSEQLAHNLKDIAALPLEGVGLVTASALLDLMPRDWVIALAKRLSAARVPFYGALNYNGAMHWSPAHDDDDRVTQAFNAHQCTDKGLGPALGPTSGEVTAQIFADHGFTVTQGDSPWRLDAAHADLQMPLLAGIADAAQDMGMTSAADWMQDRIALIAKGTGYVGHTDILAMPRVARA